jgi:N6-adenosine-specific RNA methylase IME4
MNVVASINRTQLDIPNPGKPISAQRVIQIEADIAGLVLTVSDRDWLQEMLARAVALAEYLRGRELQRPMLGAARRLEARIGMLLPNEQGKRTDLELPVHAPEVKDHILADFRILGRALDGECELDAEQWRKSRRALVGLIRRMLGLTPETPSLPAGQYRCIVADPPWQLDTGPDTFGGTIELGHEPLGYDRMSVDEIKALGVGASAADDAHLYLWTTNRYIEAAYEVVRAWGFKPSVLLVWAKRPHGVGLGDAYRLTTEFILYARRGSLKEKRIVETTWFQWPRGKHSVKPEAFYEQVESANHAPYLDMFARQKRSGWDAWGHEAPV